MRAALALQHPDASVTHSLRLQSYYNLSVYPVNYPASWSQSSLNFASLQTLASTGYAYNAVYNWPYSPGFGGAANCPLATGLAPTVTACQPIVRVPHAQFCSACHAF